jgi:hypothetical protein
MVSLIYFQGIPESLASSIPVDWLVTVLFWSNGGIAQVYPGNMILPVIEVYLPKEKS